MPDLASAAPVIAFIPVAAKGQNLVCRAENAPTNLLKIPASSEKLKGS